MAQPENDTRAGLVLVSDRRIAQLEDALRRMVGGWAAYMNDDTVAAEDEMDSAYEDGKRLLAGVSPAPAAAGGEDQASGGGDTGQRDVVTENPNASAAPASEISPSRDEPAPPTTTAPGDEPQWPTQDDETFANSRIGALEGECDMLRTCRDTALASATREREIANAISKSLDNALTELKTALARAASCEQDRARLDYLEGEAICDHPRAMFRRNVPITREAIDADMAALLRLSALASAWQAQSARPGPQHPLGQPASAQPEQPPDAAGSGG